MARNGDMHSCKRFKRGRYKVHVLVVGWEDSHQCIFCCSGFEEPAGGTRTSVRELVTALKNHAEPTPQPRLPYFPPLMLPGTQDDGDNMPFTHALDPSGRTRWVDLLSRLDNLQQRSAHIREVELRNAVVGRGITTEPNQLQAFRNSITIANGTTRMPRLRSLHLPPLPPLIQPEPRPPAVDVSRQRSQSEPNPIIVLDSDSDSGSDPESQSGGQALPNNMDDNVQEVDRSEDEDIESVAGRPDPRLRRVASEGRLSEMREYDNSDDSDATIDAP